MRQRKRVLVSWVGHADLNGFAADHPAAVPLVRAALADRYREGEPPVGPLRASANAHEYDEIHVLGDYEPKLLRAFARWLGPQASTTRVRVPDPTDYTTVYVAAETLLSRLAHAPVPPTELWIALSSGTPSMAATLVLLGKTRFPARFLQSYRGVARETEIPFDLTLEYLPELLREPDAALSALAERSPSDVEGFDAIVGNSQSIRLAVGRAKRAAIRDVSVLILGESGVGKELFARAMHAASRRRAGPFVAINCAAIPRDLQESELFGHTRGAFTGAVRDREGALRQAHGGTLFLDEFGELDPRTQASLLRALQPDPETPCRRVFRPVGADQDQHADVRVIAATNRDPHTQMRDAQLREDLFYRVSTISIRVPPLRDRRSDIPAIAHALLERINQQFAQEEPGYEPKSLSGAAKGFISRHDWPGNVRELSNVLVQAAVMSIGPTIGKADLEAAITETPRSLDGFDPQIGEGFNLQAHLDTIERRLIERAREESGGVKAHAAQLLGLAGYQTLDGKLKRLGIPWRRAAR